MDTIKEIKEDLQKFSTVACYHPAYKFLNKSLDFGIKKAFTCDCLSLVDYQKLRMSYLDIISKSPDLNLVNFITQFSQYSNREPFILSNLNVSTISVLYSSLSWLRSLNSSNVEESLKLLKDSAILKNSIMELFTQCSEFVKSYDSRFYMIRDHLLFNLICAYSIPELRDTILGLLSQFLEWCEEYLERHKEFYFDIDDEKYIEACKRPRKDFTKGFIYVGKGKLNNPNLKLEYYLQKCFYVAIRKAFIEGVDCYQEEALHTLDSINLTSRSKALLQINLINELKTLDLNNLSYIQCISSSLSMELSYITYFPSDVIKEALDFAELFFSVFTEKGLVEYSLLDAEMQSQNAIDSQFRSSIFNETLEKNIHLLLLDNGCLSSEECDKLLKLYRRDVSICT